MQMFPVISSNIKSIGYENGTLYIKFLNDSFYAYYNVPESEYKGLMSADSHGHYLAVHIKGKYSYKRLS